MDATTRRGFLKTAGTAVALSSLPLTAASYARVIGANDRITLGQIGCGGRGYGAHMTGIHPHDKEENVEYVALCDVWTVHLDRAAQRVKEWYGGDAKQCSSYKELLDMKDVDAVMIATCDHQHTTHLKAAMEAGKDAYCEKPLAMDMDSLKAATDAVTASDCIVQIGTQLRSFPSFTGCREVYQSGVLGKVSRIEQMRNAGRPYWYERISNKAAEKDVNWKEFLCGKPDRPFSELLFLGWFGFRGFSEGPVPQLGVHFLDTMHYITGAGIPQSCVCTGGTFTFNDDHHFDCPDSIQATWVYPEGFIVSYSTNFGNSTGSGSRIYGDKMTMDWSDWNAPFLTGPKPPAKNKVAGVVTPSKPIERPDHFQNWLQCLRTRKQPHAPIAAGYQHSVAAIMAMRAYDSGQRQIYDPQKREVRAG